MGLRFLPFTFPRYRMYDICDIGCMIYNVWYTMYHIQCMIYEAWYTMYDIRCIIYNVCMIYGIYSICRICFVILHIDMHMDICDFGNWSTASSFSIHLLSSRSCDRGDAQVASLSRAKSSYKQTQGPGDCIPYGSFENDWIQWRAKNHATCRPSRLLWLVTRGNFMTTSQFNQAGWVYVIPQMTRKKSAAL